MAKGIFIPEQMVSMFDERYVTSGIYRVGGVDTAIENGRLVLKGNRVTGERDTFYFGAIADATSPVWITDGEETMYSQETTKGLDDYENPAGKIIRLRRPVVGDIFAVSGEAITSVGAAPEVGKNVVTPANGNKFAELAGAVVGNESFRGTIVDSYTLGYDVLGGRQIVMYAIEVNVVL